MNFPMCFQTKSSFVQTSLSIWNIAFHDPLGVKAYKNESLDFRHSRLYKQPSQPDLVRLSEIYINKKLRKGLSCSSSVAFICSLNMLQNIQVLVFLLYKCTYITVYYSHFKGWWCTHSIVLHIDFPFNTLPFALLTPLLSGSRTK